MGELCPGCRLQVGGLCLFCGKARTNSLLLLPELLESAVFGRLFLLERLLEKGENSIIVYPIPPIVYSSCHELVFARAYFLNGFTLQTGIS